MPIYEYTCADCGHDFEKLRRMNAGPPPCPSCAGEHCEKQVSASAFILKGSGWYKDHYGLKKSGDSSADTSSKPDAGDTPAKTSDAVSSKSAPAESAAAKPAAVKAATTSPKTPKASK